MGWFWSDSRPTVPSFAPHPVPSAAASPPAGCPMHKSSSSSASPFAPPSTRTQPAQLSSSSSSSPPSSCPVQTPASPQHKEPPASTLSKLNPLNYMPTLSQTPAANQRHALPVSREISSIPRGDTDANWEYPSPQQMYHAMLRKGWDGSDADAVESMVAVHNFLNEGAWAEIVGWERRFARGLAAGWPLCVRGEEGFAREEESRQRMRAAALASTSTSRNKNNTSTSTSTTTTTTSNNNPDADADADADPQPKLLRFMGRPGDMTPKARTLQVLGWLYPSRFATDPPFDRHDWFVLRPAAPSTSGGGGAPREVRYVIDYYSGDPEPTGEPVFYLDVRPAVDGPTAAVERLMRWGGDVWYRASGGAARA